MSAEHYPRKEPEPIEKVWLSVSDYARLLRIEEAADIMMSNQPSAFMGTRLWRALYHDRPDPYDRKRVAPEPSDA